MTVEFHFMPHRRVRPLGAIHPFTHRAADADRFMRTPARSVEFIGIGKVAGMVDFTAKRDGKFRRRLTGRGPGTRHRSRDGEEFLPVRQFGRLEQHSVRSPKGLVNIPPRTGAAILGELHATGGKPLGDIAGIIDPNEEERDAAGIWGVQAGQAVAYLLETGTKPTPQQIKFMAQLARRFEKRFIWHHHRGCKIPSQRRAEQRARRIIGDAILITQLGYQIGLFDQRRLHEKMENSLRATQRLADQNFPPMLVIAPQLRSHRRRRDYPHPQTKTVPRI